MATSRDDFVIAIRSAFLKKGNKQRFSLIGLIFFSIGLLIVSKINLPVTNYLNIVLNEMMFNKKNLRAERVNYLISKFELDNLKEIKAKYLSGGQKRKLVLALALLSEPKILLLDEPFAALDVLTIKMLQEIIVNLQNENRITICICDHIASSLLQVVDSAMILSNGKIVAKDTPSNLVNNISAKNAYFGENFKFN